MDIKVFELVGKTENKARLFFKKQCWKNGRVFCARCRGYRIYRIADKRYRCKRCGYTFHDFSGRWINRLNISFKQWLWIIKLFELEISARKSTQQVGLSYPTVLKATRLIRLSLVAGGEDVDELLAGEVEMDEAYFGGRRKGKRGRGAHSKVPVFGILERNGVVKLQVVKNVSAKSLLEMTVKTVRRGSIVYTDKFKSYDTLMFCGYRHLRIDHHKHFASGKVYINGLEGFWSFAKERLIKYHGVSQKHFPLYLKELEFRYNNKDKNLFILIVKNLCNLVSNLL